MNVKEGTSQCSVAPQSILSDETFAGSQDLSPSGIKPAGAGARATCSCVRKRPCPDWPRLARDPFPCPGYPGSPLLG